MPIKDKPGIIAATFIAENGSIHWVPAYADEKNPKMAKPMKGHVFSGHCCYKKSIKQPNGKVVMVHSIIH